MGSHSIVEDLRWVNVNKRGPNKTVNTLEQEDGRDAAVDARGIGRIAVCCKRECSVRNSKRDMQIISYHSQVLRP
jgi:hypothetical protein